MYTRWPSDIHFLRVRTRGQGIFEFPIRSAQTGRRELRSRMWTTNVLRTVMVHCKCPPSAQRSEKLFVKMAFLLVSDIEYLTFSCAVYYVQKNKPTLWMPTHRYSIKDDPYKLLLPFFSKRENRIQWTRRRSYNVYHILYFLGSRH